MKSHKIENVIFIISIISLVLFIISLPIHFVFGNRFLISNFASRFFYAYGSIAPFTIFVITWRRKRRGYKKPLSIEAMRNAKAELPNVIYKFCSLSTNEEDDLDKKKLYSLRNKKIWMSDCSVLNDPFEGQYGCIPEKDINSNVYKALKDSILHQRDIYIQSSFSYCCDSILMWGHYANGCRGYCIEYTINSDEYLFPVQYVDERPLLASIFHDNAVNNNLEQAEKSFLQCESDEEKISYMLYIQSMKSSVWSYEKEVRLINIGEACQKQKCGNVDCSLYGLDISKIIVGYQCVHKDELKKIAKELNVPITIMEIPMHSKRYYLKEKPLIE